MGLWSLLFTDKEEQQRHRAEEAEIERLGAYRRDTVQVAQSSSRVMRTMAGAMQMMARGDQDENR